MATTTTRWSLRKPAAGDTISPTLDLGGPYDTIDANLGTYVCTSATRPGSPIQGQTIYETDTRREYIWSGSVWLPRGPLVAVKTTDKTANASTTLSDDPQLSLPVLASTTYLLSALLIWSTGTGPDAKFGLTVPAGCTWQVAPFGIPTSVTATAGSIETAVFTASGIPLGGVAAGTKTAALVTGTVVVGGTAGTVTISWAQNTSNASNTVLYTGSSLQLTRV
ncbi:hypothetical protein GCM10023403_10760 [Pseudonocardia benzenivorans]